jgi:CRP/FNR family transcriptional regulator
MNVAAAATATLKTQLEDPLVYLPLSNIVEYRRRQRIYTYDNPATALYLVVKGSVKLTRIAPNGRLVVAGICQPDELFGESALLNLPHRSEEATAMEDTKIIAWTMPVLAESMMRRPPLAMALMQVLTQRTIDLKETLESFATETTARRLARWLGRFADRWGVPHGAGAQRIAPLTHSLLGQCVGTSREVISALMNQLRRQGLLEYSRQFIIVHPEVLRNWLGQEESPNIV